MNRKTIRPIIVISILALAAAACQFSGNFLDAFQDRTQELTEPGPPPVQISEDLLSQQEALVSLYENASAGVVSIVVATEQGGGQGSGFVYDNDGHIVTNFHVVQGATAIEVAFTSGEKVIGEVIGTDPDSDLAVVQVDIDSAILHPLTLGDSEQLQVGQYVVAIGNPFGLQGSMSVGIVSSLGRSLESLNPAPNSNVFFSAGDLIQTDAAINPGNSGGPLLNLHGEVVGVNRAIRSFSSNVEGDALNSGIGFAVSSTIVSRVVPSLINEGHFDYPYLGISSFDNLSLTDAQELGLNRTDGALITSVAPGGPGDEAGLQQGDFITAIDGRDLNSFDDLIGYLFTQRSPGDTVELQIIRGGEEITVAVVLGARP
ncbi:MAG: S1C family serine protease [Anaerolineales bacterium]